MTACPSGVQYDQLIEAARVWTEEALQVAVTGSGVTGPGCDRSGGGGRARGGFGGSALGEAPDP